MQWWAWLLVWAVGWAAASHVEFGLVFLISSGLIAILSNMAAPGESAATGSGLSAYSVFNKNQAQLPGSIDAKSFVESYVAGGFAALVGGGNGGGGGGDGGGGDGGGVGDGGGGGERVARAVDGGGGVAKKRVGRRRYDAVGGGGDAAPANSSKMANRPCVCGSGRKFVSTLHACSLRDFNSCCMTEGRMTSFCVAYIIRM
jgi:hypothetical protein